MEKLYKKFGFFKDNWLVFVESFVLIYVIYATELNNATTLDHLWHFNGNDFILENGMFPVVTFPSVSLKSILAYFITGRPSSIISDFVWWFLGIFGASIYTHQWVPKLLMMACLAISATIITNIFSRFFEQEYTKYIINILVMISFINPLFIEVWSYTAVEWTLGIMCGALAVKLYSNRKYILAGILVFLSVGFYESYFENFLILCSAYVYVEYKDRFGKKTIIEYTKMCLLAIIPVIINLLCQRLAAYLYNKLYLIDGAVVQASSEVKASISIEDIGIRLYQFGWIYFTHFVGDVFGYYPRYFLYAILIIIFVITSVIIYKRYGLAAEIHYMIFFVMEIVWFLVVFIGTEYHIEARIAWNTFMSISMYFVIFYLYVENAKERVANQLFVVILSLFCFVNVYVTNTKVADYYIARASDHQYLDSVQAEIERYEDSTGNIITKIYTIGREDITQQSDYLLLKANVNAYDRRLVSKGWADVEALNYFEGENYISLDMTIEEYIKYFGESKSYNCFVPEEQLVFVDDALYWYIF